MELCYLLPQTNIGTLVVSIVAIIGLILAKELNTYLSKKLPVPLPVELVAVSIQGHLKHTKYICGQCDIYPVSVFPGYYCYSNLLASWLRGEIWSGCGRSDSLGVRTTHTQLQDCLLPLKISKVCNGPFSLLCPCVSVFSHLLSQMCLCLARWLGTPLLCLLLVMASPSLWDEYLHLNMATKWTATR